MDKKTMREKMDAETFKRLFAQSGSKVVKGRPVINQELLEGTAPTSENKRVRNTVVVYDELGNKLADSKWEFRCLKEMRNAKLDFVFQKKFLLIPTIRRKSLGATLRKRTWTVDFAFDNLKVIADAKGFTTEMARLKIQLFAHLYPDWEVYIIKNLSELFTFINLIKNRQNG